MFPLPFLGHFEGGFAGASELSEPESFLGAIWSLASELSKVEVLSLLLYSGRWSSTLLYLGAGPQSELFLPC